MASRLTADLARFATGLTYEALPAGAVGWARTGFTDCVAVVLAGRRPEHEGPGGPRHEAVTAQFGHRPIRGESSQDRVEAVGLQGGGFHAPPSAPWVGP